MWLRLTMYESMKLCLVLELKFVGSQNVPMASVAHQLGISRVPINGYIKNIRTGQRFC